MKVTIFRLGHRVFRDQRLTTHVFLAARALGASNGIYSGEHDKGLEDSIQRVSENWGGDFRIKYEKDWRKVLKEWKGDICHLTVYGLPFQAKAPEIRKRRKGLLVVVGGEKVPPEVYQQAGWNLSVTGQPHSEVASLSLFLHELFEGRELDREFSGWRLKVVPQERGKKTLERKTQ